MLLLSFSSVSAPVAPMMVLSTQPQLAVPAERQRVPAPTSTLNVPSTSMPSVVSALLMLSVLTSNVPSLSTVIVPSALLVTAPSSTTSLPSPPAVT